MKLTNPLKTTLDSGSVSIGSWLNLASPLAAEILATEGFDVTIRDNIFVFEQVKKIYNNLFKYEEINV